MGAKFSKGGKVKQNGTDATHDESLDTFNKTSTLPASFRKKDDEVTKTGTLPRGGVDLDRNKSFSKRFRKSITKLVGQNEVKEEASESETPSKPCNNAINQDENKENLKDVVEEQVDSTPKSTPKELDIKTAQKIARARFFQDLYNSKEPAQIPKPPRSRNLPSPVETDAELPSQSTLGTPVVKLIKKHEGEIEKQQELIGTNNSINIPEKEKKDVESPQDIPADDVVCASEQQVGGIKQEEVSAVKGETNSMEEENSQAAIKEETSNPIMEEKTSIPEQKASGEELEIQPVKEATTNYEENEHGQIDMHQANDENLVTQDTNVTTSETNSLMTQTTVLAASNEIEEEKEKSSDTYIDTHQANDENLVTQETIVTTLETESLMTQTTVVAASNEIEDEKEKSSDMAVNLESTIKESLSAECEVENTKEQMGSALHEEMSGNESESDDKEPQAIFGKESEIDSKDKTDEINTEKVVKGETKEKDNKETVISKDNGGDSMDGVENKAISSQEENESVIDPSSSCNAQQDNIDDNITEPNSLESINQTDEINQSVTEEKHVESTETGESDLVKETVIVDNDLRSEGGSEEGVSTDEGIVASDDEENKSEIQKVNNLDASEKKTVDKSGDDNEPANEL